MMSADTIGKLITISLTLLGAYVALASFTPTIIKQYSEVFLKRGTSDSEKRKFDNRFDSIKSRINYWTKAFPIFYVLTGISASLLIINLIFIDIKCVNYSFTCEYSFIPQILAGLLIFSALIYLGFIAFLFLQLFMNTIELAFKPEE